MKFIVFLLLSISFLAQSQPLTLVTDLPTNCHILNGKTLSLHCYASGEGIITYQWYKNGTIMSGDTNTTLSFVVDSSYNKTSYYCNIINFNNSIPIDTIQTRVCSLFVFSFYNPFNIRVIRYSETQVIVNILRDVDLSNFPATLSLTPWADSVWLFYKTNDYTKDTSNAHYKKYSTNNIKQLLMGDTLKDTLTVDPLQSPHDSCFWFNHSVLWHSPGDSDQFTTPFVESDKVFMLDTTSTFLKEITEKSNLSLFDVHFNSLENELHINYYFKSDGVYRIQFKLFNLQGKVVWFEDITNSVFKLQNKIILDIGSNNANNIVPGLYLMQIRVHNNFANKIEVFQQKISIF